MFKIASVSEIPPQTPSGELTTLPQTPYSREGLLAFGNRNFAAPNKNTRPAPKHKILEPPLAP